MKNKWFSILFGLIMVAGGCAAPKYLPKSSEIDISQYGSYIKVTRIQGTDVNGELLSVDTTSLIVLTDTNEQKIVKIVPLTEVKDFSLLYAQSKNYWWTIVPYTVLCASHGWYAIITAPVNLIVTFVVAISSQTDFRYTMDEISYVQLKMFARFPTGIPSNVILSGPNMNIQ